MTFNLFILKFKVYLCKKGRKLGEKFDCASRPSKKSNGLTYNIVR